MGDVRLANSVVLVGGSTEYGRLEVFSRGGWNTVCGNAIRTGFFGDDDSEEEAITNACQRVGYQDGVRIQQLVRHCHSAKTVVPG